MENIRDVSDFDEYLDNASSVGFQASNLGTARDILKSIKEKKKEEQITVVWVPGACEIVVPAKKLAVAGKFDAIADSFTTKSGRNVALAIHVDPGDAPRALYAMDALKRAISDSRENPAGTP